MAGIAGALKCCVQSVYPQAASFVVRNDFNTMIYPREQVEGQYNVCVWK